MREPETDRSVSVEIATSLHKLDLLDLLDWLDPDRPALSSNLPALGLDRSALDAALALNLPDLDAIDQWCDQFLKRRRVGQTLEQSAITFKRDPPWCVARTNSRALCKAPAVWDKRANRPRNGRCRIHGGLSSGPSAPGVKFRSMSPLKSFKRSEAVAEQECGS